MRSSSVRAAVLSLASAASAAVCAPPALSAQENEPSPAAASDPAAGYVAIDYAAVDREIRKEPTWVAEPRYALFVLDLRGEHRVWAVADKSTADAEYYDVLYLDLNGNGDLTEAGERFTGKYDAKLAPAGMGLTIRVGEIPVPGTDLVHTKFLVSTAPKSGRDGFWFRMQWNGEQEMSGGYGAVGSNTTRWRKTAAEAPIIRPCPYGPLTFAAWGTDELELRAGHSIHLNVIAGNTGSGPDTLAVVDEDFLDLTLDALTVTVIAKDRDGNEVRETSRILEHC